MSLTFYQPAWPAPGSTKILYQKLYVMHAMTKYSISSHGCTCRRPAPPGEHRPQGRLPLELSSSQALLGLLQKTRQKRCFLKQVTPPFVDTHLNADIDARSPSRINLLCSLLNCILHLDITNKHCFVLRGHDLIYMLSRRYSGILDAKD